MMKKKVLNFTINFAIFWIVADCFSGFKAPQGVISNLYAGVSFALVLIIAEWLRTFLGLPKLLVVKLLVSTVVTFAMLYAFTYLAPNFFSFGESQLGGTDFLFFSIPKIAVLQDVNLVLIFAALIANTCSIIIMKLKH